jgi:hypothetical protein
MNPLLKYWSLPRREKFLFCEAAALLLISKLSVKTIAFRYIEDILRVHWNDAAKRDLNQAYDNKLIKVSLSRAENLLPSSKRPCLPRSIAEFVMFRRRGIPAVMYMGVKLSANSLLVAHAWVDAGSEGINPSSENCDYTPLVAIGEGQASPKSFK